MNAAAAAKLLQLCPTLCDPIGGRPPGSSVPGILQARILEWVAVLEGNKRRRVTVVLDEFHWNVLFIQRSLLQLQELKGHQEGW